MGSLTVRLKAEGDGLAARGDYEDAALKYQQAANQEPDDVSLRFALGSALSHLGRREETVQQFRFVVARGKPDSAEVQAARRWLIAAGESAEAVTFAPSGETAAAPSGSPQRPPAFDLPPGKVRGKIEARGGQGRDVHISLIGDEQWNTNLAFPLTGRLGQPFEFDKVPPGNYRVTVEDRETGDHLWDEPVTVTAGKETVLDLK